MKTLKTTFSVPGRPRSLGIWKMAVRNIGRRPRRSVLSISAIGVAALAMVFLMAFLAGMKEDMGLNIRRYQTGDILIQHRLFEKKGVSTPELLIQEVSTLKQRLGDAGEGLTLAPRIQTMGLVMDPDTQYFPVFGLDFSKDPIHLEQMFTGPGSRLPASGLRECLVTTALARSLGLEIGSELTFLTRTLRSSNGMTLTVTGIVQSGLSQFGGPILFTSLATTQRLCLLGDRANQVLVNLDSRDYPRIGEIATGLTRVLAGLQPPAAGETQAPLRADPWYATSAIYSYLSLIDVMYVFIGAIFFGLASTVIINTMLMVVLERQKEIGTLAAMGMERRTIRRLFLAETAILAGIGCVAGSILGSVVAIALNHIGLDMGQALSGMDFEISSVIRPLLPPGAPVLTTVVGILVALGFTLLPLKRIETLEIVEAIRGEK